MDKTPKFSLVMIKVGLPKEVAMTLLNSPIKKYGEVNVKELPRNFAMFYSNMK